MNEKYKKTCKYLNYVDHLLIVGSTVTGCVSISTFASLRPVQMHPTFHPTLKMSDVGCI